jgi:hypothetical protein
MNSRVPTTGGASSILDTIDHIQKVQRYLGIMIAELIFRSHSHDASKLMPPELDGYAGLSDAVRGLQYGTDEYRAAFAPFKGIIKHHYEANDHHPEHFPDSDISKMNLLQIIEMIADWKAASTRNNSTLMDSLDVSFKRFGIDEQLAAIVRNTVEAVEW